MVEKEEPVVEAAKVVEPKEEPKVEAKVEEAQKVEEKSAAKVVDPVTEKPKEQELKVEEPKPVAVKAVPKEEPKKTAKVPEPKRSSNSATIVRRATPEESNALKQQELNRHKSKKDDRGQRKPFNNFAVKSHIKRRDPAAPSQESASSSFSRNESQQGAASHTSRPDHNSYSNFGKPRRAGESDYFSDDKKRTQPKQRTFSPKTDFKRGITSGAYDSDFDGGFSGRRRFNKRQREMRNNPNIKKTQITVPRKEYRVVKMEEDTILVSALAKQLSIKSTELIKKLMQQGLMVTINQSLDFDTASLMASEYDYECKLVKKTVDDILKTEKEEELKDLVPRPPIITVMGHVDHGKTSILDAIRKTGVAEKEAGGITQHIGAYMVKHNDSNLTFIDTPGHESFSAMRARGAKLTDIVILVVAADDGVMPQTIEAIAHAKAAEVPIIVAVNKIDKQNINLDRIYSELSEQGVQSEDWGGETQFVHVSALKNQGLDDLLEAVTLQSEMLDLQASSTAKASAVVVESHLDKARGAVATVIMTHGTLKTGDFVVVGTVTGRVRTMKDHNSRTLKEATASMPVELMGLNAVPLAGDSLNWVEDDKTARDVVALRIQESEAAKSASAGGAQSFDQLLSKMQSDDLPRVSLIIKTDVQGTAEAISEAIAKLKSEQVQARVVYKGVGGITESDLNLAQTCNAAILGFNVRMPNSLVSMADKNGTVVRYYSVIYELIDAVKEFMAGKLDPITKEVIQGHAEVKDAIRIPKIGLIAGSSVTDGKIVRGSHLRLVRDNVVIHTGKMAALKRFKEDVKEVQTGYECGISFEGYSDVKVGDVIEAFIIEESPAQLDI